MSKTFEVCGNARNIRLSEENEWSKDFSVKEGFEHELGTPVESCSGEDTRLVHSPLPGVAGAVYHSFADHLPLILDPDSIWLTLEVGLAKHINLNAEDLRKQFVNFEGKVLIKIQRNGFIKGNPDNDWQGCFPEFSDKISEYIGKKRDLIVSNFSTTNPMRKAASEIVLMDAMSSYFDYGVNTACGIPAITLEGETKDWEDIRDRAKQFEQFGLGWWTKYLLPTLDEFIEASKGNPDIDFWKSLYNEGGGSGGPFISGRVLSLYPYLGRDNTQNDFKYMTAKASQMWGGITSSQFPRAISQVPFVWKYYNTNFPMEFTGGIIGVEQQEDYSVRAAFGWAIREACIPLRSYNVKYITEGLIVHSKNDTGIVKSVEVYNFGKLEKLDTLVIKWEKGGIKEHKAYNLKGIFVKDAKTD